MSFEIARATFLGGTLAGIAATSNAPRTPVTSVATSPTAAPAFDDTVSFAFDREAFFAMIDKPYAHRQFAPATTPAAAEIALASLQGTIDAYADTAGFAAGPKSVHAATVFYGGPSIVVALDDAAWAAYPLDEIARSIAAAHQTAPASPAPLAKKNPYSDLLGPLARDHDANFFVCNNALSGLAVRIAYKGVPDKATPARADVVRIRDDLVARFVPGAVLVPSGVATINALQEARYTLLPQHP